MDFHLDYALRLRTETEYRSLYDWAIYEVDAAGSISRDQIPWAWTLHFDATSCLLVNSVEIEKRFSLSGEGPADSDATRQQSIRIALKPSDSRQRTTFSMFGTNRAIEDFTLQILQLGSDNEQERCSAWGTVSYSSEIDFEVRTQPDCLWFYLYVKPRTFVRYVDLIDKSAVSSISFSVGSVEGFYSDWSPSISTSSVKVLLPGNEQPFNPPIEPVNEVPRLGKIHTAKLYFSKTLDFSEQARR